MSPIRSGPPRALGRVRSGIAAVSRPADGTLAVCVDALTMFLPNGIHHDASLSFGSDAADDPYDGSPAPSYISTASIDTANVTGRESDKVRRDGHRRRETLQPEIGMSRDQVPTARRVPMIAWPLQREQ